MVEIMKETISIIIKIIVIILADVFTIFARKMSIVSQSSYSQTSEYVGLVIWIIVVGILFGISIKICDVERNIYKILTLLFLFVNIIYIIYSIRYYGTMTLGLFVSVVYLMDLLKIKNNITKQ